MKFITIISLLFSQVSAQGFSAAEILQNIRLQYSLINDGSATFTQSVKIRYKKTGQEVTGTVKIKKGNKYRIETDQQTIITDGTTVWMFNPISKQVLIDRFKQNGQPFSPDKFLLGLPKEFTAIDVAVDSQYYRLNLQSTKTGAASTSITALKIWVRPESWVVEKIEIIDKNSTATTISLTNIHFNKGISDKEFQFEISKDMNVVDLTATQ